MSHYVGLDLHGNNVYCVIMDNEYQTVLERRLPNELKIILETLEPYRSTVKRLAVESTYNWYWLVDGLRKEKYDVRLANPARMQAHIGLKAANDKTDARFIARQLAMNILPEGYIYPQNNRSLRDLVRQRMRLVHTRTGEWLSLEGLVARYSGKTLGISNLEQLSKEDLSELLSGDVMAIEHANLKLRHIEFLNKEITQIEQTVEKHLKLENGYERLLSVPGIGKILAMVIMVETGSIKRFTGSGNYSSYCRTVKAQHTSNDRKKGSCNKKNGNRYLSWAYIEAANFAIRYSPELKKWYQRKLARTKRVVALKALANKLSKACYFILRDGVDFDVRRLVG